MSKPGMMSFIQKDVAEYVIAKSNRQTQDQKDLDAATLKHPRCRMLGSCDSLQHCSNLIQLIGGKKVIDLGVYTGASSLAWGLAIPEDGKIFALDMTDEYLQIGRPFWAKSGIEHKVNLMLGPAADSLQKLLHEGHENSFDFAFIDADKENMILYYETCLKLIRKGGFIGVDNTLWSGSVVDPTDKTEETISIREFNNAVRNDPRINLSFLPIGDGLTLCFKK